MHKIVDNVLVLKRVDYGEADRIISVLSQHGGKFSLLAKGVRKPKSKLAGGIEPFCINSVTYLQSPRELKTLVSASVHQLLDTITKDIDTLNTGYQILRTINAFTEHECEDDYYTITASGLQQLNNGTHRQVVYVWFMTQLLKLSGHGINTDYAADGSKLVQTDTFVFDYESMAFKPDPHGRFNANHVKVLRLAQALTMQSFALVQQTQQSAIEIASVLSDIASTITQKNLK